MVLALAFAGSAACGDDAQPLTFYEPSTVLGDGEPGDILERSPITLQASITGVGTRVTFASTTPAGDLVPVTGVVIQPLTPPPPGGYPVVVWGHGTVGLGDPSAPSRSEPFGFAGAEQLVAAGYLLVAPDYEGLGVEGETHPYLVGIATGDNLLDGVRVGKSFGGGERFVVFGASQGGHATLFARQRAEIFVDEPEDLDTWATAMAMNTPGADDLGVPLLLTHGDADVTVPLSGTEALHHALCQAGEDVVFLRDPAWDHISGWIDPIPQIVDWISGRFAGERPPNDCDDG